MLEKRSLDNEQMDDLSLNGDRLTSTLKELSLINRLLGNTQSSFKCVKRLINEDRSKSYKIIDIGCGGGDNLIKIGEWCIKNSINTNLIGIDGNPNILAYANKQSKLKGIEIQFQLKNILSEDFNLPNCTILISSHFIYHFNDNALVEFLVENKKRVGRAMIFSDLYRSPIAYILFKLVCYILPLNQMVKKDGLQAIKRSFKRVELVNIMNKASIEKYQILNKFVFRYLLIIKSKP